VKYAKAVECLVKDCDVLPTFYDFPAEHWKHLRTSNPIEGTFATVHHRAIRSRGCTASRSRWCSNPWGAAEKSWRRLDGHNQLPKLILGAEFKDRLEIATSRPIVSPQPPDRSGHHQIGDNSQ
jgi:putative transposase